MFYRESSDPLLLESTRNIVGSILPAFSATPPTSLFIATWFYVGYFDNNDDRVSAYNTHSEGMLVKSTLEYLLPCRQIHFSVCLAPTETFPLPLCSMPMR